MKKRALFSLLVVLSLLVSLIVPALAEDVIKIGGIGVLSGDNSKYGLAVKEGVDLYVKQINAAGGILGKQVEVIWEDTQADPAFAISACSSSRPAPWMASTTPAPMTSPPSRAMPTCSSSPARR